MKNINLQKFKHSIAHINITSDRSRLGNMLVYIGWPKKTTQFSTAYNQSSNWDFGQIFHTHQFQLCFCLNMEFKKKFSDTTGNSNFITYDVEFFQHDILTLLQLLQFSCKFFQNNCTCTTNIEVSERQVSQIFVNQKSSHLFWPLDKLAIVIDRSAI